MSGFSLICCIVNIGDAEKTITYAKKYSIKGGTVSLGKGTVHSHWLEVLGLNEVRKEIVKMIVANDRAAEALEGIGRDMSFHKPHHGIAFSMPMSEFICSGNEVESICNGNENNFETNEVKDTMYKAIYVVVDRGEAEDVIEAAKEAGARGATIINARGIGIGEARMFFNMKIVPEKEEVFILTKTELKDTLVEAIKKHAKIDEMGNGMLFVMDVNEAYGLR